MLGSQTRDKCKEQLVNNDSSGHRLHAMRASARGFCAVRRSPWGLLRTSPGSSSEHGVCHVSACSVGAASEANVCNFR